MKLNLSKWTTIVSWLSNNLLQRMAKKTKKSFKTSTKAVCSTQEQLVLMVNRNSSPSLMPRLKQRSDKSMCQKLRGPNKKNQLGLKLRRQKLIPNIKFGPRNKSKNFRLVSTILDPSLNSRHYIDKK